MGGSGLLVRSKLVVPGFIVVVDEGHKHVLLFE